MQRGQMRSTAGHSERTTWPGRAVAVLVCAAGLLLASCGGGKDEAASSTTVTTSSGPVSTISPAGGPASTISPAGGPGGTVTVMPLGDSLTEGGDPDQPTTSPQTYRGYLYTSLVEAGYDVDFVGSQQTPAIGGVDPDNEGHGGFSIGPDDSTLCGGCPPANIDRGLQGWLSGSHPDVVLLMIGVNDFLGNDNSATGGGKRVADPGQAADKLKALVGRIRTLEPDATVVVASYPPTTYLVDPALPSHLDFAAFNAAAAELGDGSDDHVVYAPMAETFAKSWTAADVIGDQLHPSATGAERIADVWLKALEPVLDARR